MNKNNISTNYTMIMKNIFNIPGTQNYRKLMNKNTKI